LAEAYQREAATADVLQAISRSTVLDTLVESAAKLCRGQSFNPAAPRLNASAREELRILQRTVHVEDLQADTEGTFIEGSRLARFAHGHTILGVPMLREGLAILPETTTEAII
jgi:hypothetical protein